MPGADLVAASFRALDAAAAEYGPAPVWRLAGRGGISACGAHARAPRPRPADRAGAGGLRARRRGLVLALPAWTGAPGAVAAATAASADLVERLGTAAALAAAGTAVGWVAAELAAAWPAYGDGLAASLRAAAAAPGPTLAELAALPVPAGLVAFADDPLHPAAVAQEWAAAIPRAAVRELPLVAPAADRSVLAATALAALTAARAG